MRQEAFEIVRPEAGGNVVLVCDHASNRIPSSLGTLGVSENDLRTHIAWDIGAAEVARHLSTLLDATLVLATWSRLVVDLNRPPHVPGVIPASSAGIRIPGNEGLDDASRAARIEAFHRPYHDAIAALLDARTLAGRIPVLVSIHSFTPEPLFGKARPWPISMLYGSDVRLAHRLAGALRADDPGLLVGDNEPYRVGAETDWGIPVHGIARGIVHTAVEILQDGVATAEAARAFAERIARALSACGV